MKGLRFRFQSLGRKVRGSGTSASEALIGCKVPRNLLDPFSSSLEPYGRAFLGLQVE